MKHVLLLASILFVRITVAGQENYLVSNVTVIPMNAESVLPKRDVVIRNGKIAAILPSGKTSYADLKTVDGTGKFLLPGLFDMHVHFFQEQGEHRNTNEAELKMMVANGLTTTRIMAGHPSYLEARQNVRMKQWLGPELFIASPQFVGRWPWPVEFKNFEIVATAADAASAVRKYKNEGYDAIKVTFMVKKDAYDAIVSTAKEVGIKVVGHVGPEVKLPAALSAGEQIEHMDEFIDMLLPDSSFNRGQSVSDMNIWRKSAWATVPYLDENKLPDLVRAVKNSGVTVTPTNHFFISCFGRVREETEIRMLPGFGHIPKIILEERWKVRQHYLDNLPPEENRNRYIDLRKKMVRALWRAGVPLMAGSDSPEWFLVQGFAIHDELNMFVEAGLTPFAALQTATINPARYLGIDSRTGTIELNKEADLLLLDKNPLESIANTRAISGVFVDGRWIDASGIKALLNESKSILNPD